MKRLHVDYENLNSVQIKGIAFPWQGFLSSDNG